MRPDGHPIGILAGDMDTTARALAIERFREGLDRLLITTNVSARGMSIWAHTAEALPTFTDGWLRQIAAYVQAHICYVGYRLPKLLLGFVFLFPSLQKLLWRCLIG